MKEEKKYIAVDSTVRLRFIFEEKYRDIAQTRVHSEIEKALRKCKLERNVTRFKVSKPETARFITGMQRK